MHMQAPGIARIRPARWFRHALSARDLAATLETRSAAMDSARDGRAAFCRLRAKQAALARDLIEHGAFGAAAAWVERLEVQRTHGYLRALESWDRGDLALTPAPWRAVFALHRQREIEAPLSLALSAHVHEAYDLPMALARVGDATGGDTLAAFATLGELHASAIDRFQQDVLKRYAARSLSGGALPIASATMRERWGEAWLDAQEIAGTGDDARVNAAFARIETAALAAIRRSMAEQTG